MPVVTTQTTGVFTGYDLGELRARVLRLLRVANPTRFSPTNASTDYDWVDDSINRGQDAFVRGTKCLRNYAIIELQNGKRNYRMPDDYLDLMTAYFYDSSLSNGYKELTVTTIEELNDDVSDWRVDTGTPGRIYLDRNYGSGQLFGLYPIPDTDGDSAVFNIDDGVVVEWVCPLYALNQDVGVIINADGVDEFILPSDTGVTVQIEPANKNLLLEYYRLPQEINVQGDDDSQKTEIPREYQQAICYYSAYDLLSNCVQDSAELKRAEQFFKLFEREIQMYKDRKKRPLSGHNLRARALVWNWTKNMTFYKEMA
ncbi:MAG: hypothetical protein ABIH39_00395 [Candidatus Margulisiibacteriota bacterium]